MKDLVFLPDLTLDCLKSYAKKSVSEKGFKEGKNLQLANHVRSVQYNNISDCIKYCVIQGEVVPQTIIIESSYKCGLITHFSLYFLALLQEPASIINPHIV